MHKCKIGYGLWRIESYGYHYRAQMSSGLSSLKWSLRMKDKRGYWANVGKYKTLIRCLTAIHLIDAGRDSILYDGVVSSVDGGLIGVLGVGNSMVGQLLGINHDLKVGDNISFKESNDCPYLILDVNDSAKKGK